jgi:hypothetical protein
VSDDLAERQARDTAAPDPEAVWRHTADAARRIIAARPCATCDGGDPRCKDCFGLGVEVVRCEQCDEIIETGAPIVLNEWGGGPPFCSEDCREAHAERRSSR